MLSVKINPTSDYSYFFFRYACTLLYPLHSTLINNKDTAASVNYVETLGAECLVMNKIQLFSLSTHSNGHQGITYDINIYSA